ncbi:MAG TPA: hypothetical protein EYP63_07240 [Desulfotomaculum sp.]|nr:hypothetical protein [Desulfotomaculum sp.]
MLPLSYYFYKKALAKSFGERVRLIYQYLRAPGEYAGAADLAARICAEGLSLPVVAVGREIAIAGRLPTVEEFLTEVRRRISAD